VKRFNTNDGIFDIAWSEGNENHIISAGGDGSIKLWDLNAQLPLVNFKEHIGEVFSVGWNVSNPALICSGGMDSSVRLYDIIKPTPITQFNSHKAVVYSTVFHPTMENIIASTSVDKTVKLHDIKSNTVVKSILAHTAECMHVDFNKYENTIATAGSDGSVHIFDLRGTGDIPVAILKGHNLTCRKVQFSPFSRNTSYNFL